jgi:DNA-binding SARP family transcriptional activator
VKATPILRVHMFGGLVIHRDDWPHTARLTRGAEALFSYLILERQRSHARDTLAGLFWGDMPDDRARNCLNTALWRLRRILEPDPLHRGMYIQTTPAGDVRFNAASDYWLDVAVFEDTLARLLVVPPEQLDTEAARQLDAAIGLYAGDLLTGVFDDWALAERERLRARYLDARAHLMRIHVAHGDLQKGLACGLDVLRDDPLREEIHREVIRLYQATGQSAHAVRQYEACREVLFAELGVAPAPETETLRATLSPAPAPAAVPNLPTAAVRRAFELLVRATRALEEAQRQVGEALRAVDPPPEDASDDETFPPGDPEEYALRAQGPRRDGAVRGA